MSGCKSGVKKLRYSRGGPGFVKYHLATLSRAKGSLFESQDLEEIRGSRALPVVWPQKGSIADVLWCLEELADISYSNIVRVQEDDL